MGTLRDRSDPGWRSDPVWQLLPLSSVAHGRLRRVYAICTTCRISPSGARLSPTASTARVRARRMVSWRRVRLQASTTASADCLHGVREERQSLVDFGVAGSQGRQQLDHLVLGACGFHQQPALERCGGHLPGKLTVLEGQALS
jgi:hypothetical protein